MLLKFSLGVSMDYYKFASVLDEVGQKQGKLLEELQKLIQFMKNENNPAIDRRVESNLRRLRVLRARVKRIISNPKSIELDGLDEYTRDSIAVLSEYMLIVGYLQEKMLINELISILNSRDDKDEHIDIVNRLYSDLEEIESIEKTLKIIVNKYY